MKLGPTNKGTSSQLSVNAGLKNSYGVQQEVFTSARSTHLQTQGCSNTGGVQDPATYAEVAAAGGDALAAQLGQGVHGALAHAHVVGGDPGGKAFQAGSAAGGCHRSSGRGGGVAGSSADRSGGG